MGIYVNPGTKNFAKDINDDFYVDKSMLIKVLNNRINRRNCYCCVSRPRRFGKTMAANMISAYYSKGCDSHEIFSNLKISKDPTFEENINNYTVIKLDMNDVVTNKGDDSVTEYINKEVVSELKKVYSFLALEDNISLSKATKEIYSLTEDQFVFVIDEYDVVIRDEEYSRDLKDYLNFLVSLFKNSVTESAIALAYLTGIMPIIREKTQSKLNNFTEYSMFDAGEMVPFMGFTEDEVRSLSINADMDFVELKHWYDGYKLCGTDIYSPSSVITAITKRFCDDYWGYTGMFTSLRDLILKDYVGVRHDVIQMISGDRVSIDPMKYDNSMTRFESKDEIFTCLVHLGYLGFDNEKKECFIPNYEIKREWIRSIEGIPQYENSSEIVKHSDALMKALWKGDEETVAEGVKTAHMDISSNLTYNKENEFRCAVRYAFCTADRYYTVVNELPAGKGFADIVFIPQDGTVPLIVVELKRDTRVDKAIDQIKSREYPESLRQYKDNMILVGLSYNTTTKEHFCRIERVNDKVSR